MPKDDNPGGGNPGFVPIPFCDERTKRIEAKIEGMKNEIITALNEKNSLSWQAKATILASIVMASASILVAYIQVFG